MISLLRSHPATPVPVASARSSLGVAAAFRWRPLRLLFVAAALGAPLSLCFLVLPSARAAEAEPGVVAIKQSTLAPIDLPSGTFRFTGKTEIAQFTEALKSIAAKNHFALGAVEVLVWAEGKTAKTTLVETFKQLGYVYATEPPVEMEGGQATAMIAVQKGKPQALLGLWAEQGDTLVLAWAVATSSTPSSTTPKPATVPSSSDAMPPSTPGETITFDLDASTRNVNVMKNERPKLPPFPEVEKKPGTVRGYVYDRHGKPLKGAVIGARSTAAGGFYSGASGKTDEKGYYEIEVPWGAAHFYCAGYALDYGEGRAAMGLCPADGEADGFATANGAVENWALLPYGIADRDDLQDNPNYVNNYYGGGIVLSYSVSDGGVLASSTDLPANSKIEVTLTPDGPLVDGAAGRPILLRKRVGTFFGQLYVNNIPAGHYKIRARLTGGGELRMKETGPNGGKMFGLEPKQSVGAAGLWLRPNSAKPEMTVAAHGNWDAISITLERP
jgi:hypothetical protein